MDHRNVIPVRLIKDRTAVVEGLFQYDYGQKLLFQDVDLPSSYEVHFSNQEHGTSKTALGDETGVEIPDEFLTTGCPVYFWVFLHDGADDGETEYGGYVDVTRRAKPTNEEPTPVQQDVITQTIATLTDAVEHVDDVAGEIEDIADNIQEEIDSALQEAKDGGEFDGYTPVRGVDYWTEEDKSEFENDLREDGFVQTETDPTVPAWAKQPEKPTYTPVEVGAIPASLKGVASGVAELDSTGKVPASQLPSYVDDIVEGYYYNDKFYVESTHVTEIPGESGKIYVDLTDGSRNIYRWSGSGFAAIPIGLALGETATTAYRGDRGAAAYAAAVANVETQPHSGSNNLITSGAVYTQMEYKADKANTVLDNTLSMGRKPNTSVGTGSVALGLYETANASYSAAIGYNTTASGQYSSALGHNTTATGQSAHAEGESTTATFEAAHAEGKNTTATGIGAHSEGFQNDAVGMWAHVEGRANQANSAGAHAEGYNTVVSADYAHGEGCYTLATGSYAHVGGMYNIQDSYSSWAEWTPNTIYGIGDKVKVTDQATSSISAYECKTAHTSGSSFVYNTTIWRSMQGQMNYAEIIGNGTSSARSNARVLTWSGDEHLKGDVYVGSNGDGSGGTKLARVTEIPDISTKADKANTVLDNTLSMGRKAGTSVGSRSTALGYDVSATGQYSHSEGYGSAANSSQSHAEGYNTIANGVSSHAEGYNTLANGNRSHAEGLGGQFTSPDNWPITSQASGESSHAEGYQTYASAQGAHAEGQNTMATAQCAHAEGQATYAAGTRSHAEGAGGMFTVDGTSFRSGALSNADHSEGNNTYANSGNGSGGAHSEGMYTRATGGSSHAEGFMTLATNQAAHAEGYETKASAFAAHAEGQGGTYTLDGTSYTSGAFGSYDHVEGCKCRTGTSGSAHAEGYQTSATGYASHVEGYQSISSGSYSHAEGLKTTASGSSAHSEGQTTTASAFSAHAEGFNTVAAGVMSHAEGQSTTATTSATFSHVEGNYTTAYGVMAHAEGEYTTAIGNKSHAEGSYTVSAADYQHVSGKYNVVDNYHDRPEWEPNTAYAVGDEVYVPNPSGQRDYGHTCKTAHTSGTEFDSSKWDMNVEMHYAEIIGNGTADDARSNARALTWTGDERLKGDLYVNCNADSTGGTKVTPLPTPPVNDGTYILQCSVSSGVATYSWVTLPPASGVSF